jgi:uncharacterized protein (DUF433 family)
MEEALLKRITLNPDVCFGKPTIRNMRYPVEMTLDLLGAGMSFADILAESGFWPKVSTPFIPLTVIDSNSFSG